MATPATTHPAVTSTLTGARTMEEARAYYAKEFLDYRRGLPTPYMEKLRIPPPSGQTTDPDARVLSDADLEAAAEEGKRRKQG